MNLPNETLKNFKLSLFKREIFEVMSKSRGKLLDNWTQSLAMTALDYGMVPILLIGKKPVRDGWTNISRDIAYNLIFLDICKNPTSEYSDIPKYNIGILTGKPSGIIVIDIDIRNNGMEYWNQLISRYGDPNTFKVRTGSGAYHYYFRMTTKNQDYSSRIPSQYGIEVKSTGSQVVFPGSINYYGQERKMYRVISGYPVLNTKTSLGLGTETSSGPGTETTEKRYPLLAEIPDWLDNILLGGN